MKSHPSTQRKVYRLTNMEHGRTLQAEKSHLNYIQNVRCRFVSCPFLYIEKCTPVNANVYLLQAVYPKFNGLNAVLECNIERVILLLNMRPVSIISDFRFSCDAMHISLPESNIVLTNCIHISHDSIS